MEPQLPTRREIDRLPPGPIAVVLAEDGCELDSTLARCRTLGFAAILLLRDPVCAQPAQERLVQVDALVRDRAHAATLLTRLHRPLAGRWIMPIFNAEYLFYPYCETRSVRDLVSFMEEERRRSVFGITVDLYAEDLEAAPDGVSRDAAGFDALGYFAFDQNDPPLPVRSRLYGGVRWRFSHLIPQHGQLLNRPALYIAEAGLAIDAALALSDPDLNAPSCPWHRNPTAAILSFRVARAVSMGPSSADGLDGFVWEGTRRCAWQSSQLVDLGFMEQGQWF
ncbi:MAG: hypothetical protein AAFR46_06010 [Pseudomonadota bacterium]